MKTQTAEQKNKQNELKENKGLSDTPEKKKNIKLNKVTNLIYNLRFKFNHKIQIQQYTLKCIWDGNFQ